MGVYHVGTIDPYIAAAFSPDGETLYVNHDGSDVIAYSFPGLVAGSTVLSGYPAIGSIACDDAGTLYWWENTMGSGLVLWKDHTSPEILYFVDSIERPFGLCWSPYDDNLYGYGWAVLAEGQALHRFDKTTGTRTLVYDPPTTDEIIDWFDGTVPAPDGGVWFTEPNPSPDSSMLARFDIDVDDGDFVLVDTHSAVPRTDGSVVLFADPPGAVPAIGLVYFPNLDRDAFPAMDSLDPGVRAVAYTPSFGRVAFERGATGEVWTLVGGWRVGRVGWGTRGAWS